MIDFFYRISEWYDKSDSLDFIYLDFSKAFDKFRIKGLSKNWRVMGLGDCLKMDSRVASGYEASNAVKWTQIGLDRG